MDLGSVNESNTIAARSMSRTAGTPRSLLVRPLHHENMIVSTPQEQHSLYYANNGLDNSGGGGNLQSVRHQPAQRQQESSTSSRSKCYS